MASGFRTLDLARDFAGGVPAPAHIGTLWRVAQGLSRRAPSAPTRPLPPMWFVTDPNRTPDPVAIAERLPSGAGVIYRAFGAPEAKEVAAALSRLARRRGLTLLIGADAALALSVGADGVHLPERWLRLGPRLRARRPHWLLTGAAHGARALRSAGLAGLDAALVSPVFASASPSAARPLAPVRFAALARRSPLPVYALGGVNVATAPRLIGTGAQGLAAVEGIGGALRR